MNLTTVTPEKITITGMLAALSIWLNWLLVPLIVLIAAMLIDYATGLLAAENRGQKIDSDIGKKGVIKKVLTLLLVGVGLLIDLMLLYCSAALGYDFPVKIIVSVIVTVWMTVSELISILENVKDAGMNLPPLLEPLLKNLKSKVEGKGETVKVALEKKFDQGGGE
jgi:toxin secretion/phage lysis holin